LKKKRRVCVCVCVCMCVCMCVVCWWCCCPFHAQKGESGKCVESGFGCKQHSFVASEGGKEARGLGRQQTNTRRHSTETCTLWNFHTLRSLFFLFLNISLSLFLSLSFSFSQREREKEGRNGVCLCVCVSKREREREKRKRERGRERGCVCVVRWCSLPLSVFMVWHDLYVPFGICVYFFRCSVSRLHMFLCSCVCGLGHTSPLTLRPGSREKKQKKRWQCVFSDRRLLISHTHSRINSHTHAITHTPYIASERTR